MSRHVLGAEAITGRITKVAICMVLRDMDKEHIKRGIW